MNKLETERLVRKLAVLDNRTVNDGVVEAWYELVGKLSYEVAELSLLKVRQDASISWVEPKHVLAKSRDAITEINDARAKAEKQAEGEYKSSPQPKCLAHGLLIVSCVDCCKLIAAKAEVLQGERLDVWIDSEILE